jgi:transcriptional regulator with XRE-family HTH domain
MTNTMPRKSRLKLPPLDLGDETLGERLKRLRKARGYTQVALANAIGIIQELVSTYERDKLRLHADMVVRFAQALEVSADELLGMKRDGEHGDPLPPKLRRRMQQVASLKPNDQKALLKTIDAFLQASEARPVRT